MSRLFSPDTAPVEWLTCRLIEEASVTPEDGNCQEILTDHLQRAGFHCRNLSRNAVSNLWATRGTGAPMVVFAGHTDVVPTGPVESWQSPPFVPQVRNGMLYGRGAADMKGSLAAMVTAAEQFVAKNPDHPGSIAFLITSDEEGPAVDGTRYVVDTLNAEGVTPDYCIVGEPSSQHRLGDIVRNGRRGSLNATLTVHGVQGHVAYPDLASNPVHTLAPALSKLVAENWDNGNKYYPPTTLQCSNLHAGTGATNVIPGTLEMLFNFRFSTEQTPESLQQRVHALLDQFALDYTVDWQLSGMPFLTPAGVLTDAVTKAIAAETGVTTELSTGGGTSDGRFIAPWGVQVVELGPVNATIHQIDECVAVSDLAPLARIYAGILTSLLTAR